MRVFLILRNGQQSPDNTHQWTSGHHVGEGSRCQVPAGDSQQGLQEGLELLQVVEVLVPGKHLNQTLSMRSKINTNKNEQKEKKNKKKMLGGYSLFYRMVSKVLTTLISGHHLGEGSRCQVPAADSQQGLQNGVDHLQVVEVLITGKQFKQLLDHI